MKTTAILVLIPLCSYFKGIAQCPDLGCSTTQVVCPSSLASGCVNTAYSQGITIAVPNSIDSYTLRRIRLNSLTGLPSGLNYTCDPLNCTFNANTHGCISISGTPTTAGTYPLTANTTVTIAIGFFELPLDTALSIGSLIVTAKDCAGVCGGTATVDNCVRCSGGTTGVLPNCNDNNACTTDQCNGQGGCTYTQNCFTISGKMQTETGTAIPGVTVNLTGSLTLSMVTGSDGLYSFTVNRSGNYTVTPSKANDVSTNNGVTTVDISLIRRHVQGLTYFNSPYKTIAADGSNSGSLTTLDLSLTRVLVLNNTAKFPNNRLWEFVSSAQTFPAPAPNQPYNPFPFIKTRTFTNVTQSFTNQNFIGVKLGDVNNTWNANIN